MPRLRRQAEDRVNAHYNALAAEFAHRDHEYAAKRREAKDHLAGTRSMVIETEAAFRGVEADALAADICSQPDLPLQRGLDRVRAILAVRSAATPKDIDAALTAAGINTAFK